MSEEEKSTAPAASAPEAMEENEKAEANGDKEEQGDKEMDEEPIDLGELTVEDQDSSDVKGDSEKKAHEEEALDDLLRRYIYTSDRRLSYHPFFDKHDKIEYATEELDASAEIPEPKTLTETQCKAVSTEEEMKEMVEQLKKVSEIGVGLRMNGRVFDTNIDNIILSVDETDYCIDIVKLDAHLNLLAPIFLDPSITKVIQKVPPALWWLQEERGLFVANVFDLGSAIRIVPDDVKTELKNCLKNVSIVLQGSGIIKVSAPDSVAPAKTKKKLSDEHHLQSWSHYNLYLYRQVRKKLLTMYGVEEYLKIKHAMDDWCKVQHVNRMEIKRAQILHDIRVRQDVHKRVAAALWAWRQSVAKAQNINASKVLPMGQLMLLSSVTVPEPDFIKFVAQSDFVDKDITEVHRIIASNVAFLQRNRDRFALKLERQKFTDPAKMGVKRNQTRAEQMQAKRQKIYEVETFKTPQGIMTTFRQPASFRGPPSMGFATAPRGGLFNAFPRGNPQAMRGLVRGGFGRGGGFPNRPGNQYESSWYPEQPMRRYETFSAFPNRNLGFGLGVPSGGVPPDEPRPQLVFHPKFSWKRGDNKDTSRNFEIESEDYESGDYESGDYESGDYESGDYESGDYESGDYESGDYESGEYESRGFDSMNPRRFGNFERGFEDRPMRLENRSGHFGGSFRDGVRGAVGSFGRAGFREGPENFRLGSANSHRVSGNFARSFDDSRDDFRNARDMPRGFGDSRLGSLKDGAGFRGGIGNFGRGSASLGNGSRNVQNNPGGFRGGSQSGGRYGGGYGSLGNFYRNYENRDF